MKQPKAIVLGKMTKKERKDAEVLVKFMDSMWSPEEEAKAQEMKRILELERKTNPLGLWSVQWDSTKK